MGNTIRLSAICSLILSALLAPSGLYADEESGAYLFYGAETSASVERSYFPIVTVDKRKIHVDGGAKVIKVSKDSICRIAMKIKIAERMVEVLEMEMDTWSMTNLQRSSEALSDMQLAERSAEFQIADIESASRARGRSVLSDSEQRDVDDIETENNLYQRNMRDDFDSGSFELDELADTIQIKGELLPQADIPGAYCVMVVTFDRKDYATGSILGKERTVRAKYVGDLKKDKVFKMNTRISTAEFDKETAEYELHLYGGDGSEVAMSTSRGLKPLSVEEYRKVKTALGR